MHSNGVKFLLALKNASTLKKEVVFFYYNNLFLKLAKVLYRTGLIQNFYIEKKHNKNFQIIILLKYSFNFGILNSLKIISKPSISLFLNYEKICRISEKNRILILSTNEGFLTSDECKKRKIGGKVFFYV